MASDKSRYFSFSEQNTSASNVGYPGQMDSWNAGPYQQQQQWNSPSYQTAIMSNHGIAAYRDPSQQQRPYKPSYHQQPKKKPPSQPQVFYCEICRVSCAGPQPYAEHMKGQKHKKKEVSQSFQQKLDQSPKPVKPVSATVSRLYCDLCDVSCGGVDTFAAHIRGVKHRRVLNLHTAMGKPVPTVALPQEAPTPVPAVASTLASAAPAPSALASTSSVPAPDTKLEAAEKTMASSAAVSKDVTADEKAAVDTSDLVGQEFIEETKNEKGFVVSYTCKLCECSFTDPNARRVHLKGRRHRMQYKRKIDSTIAVDVKVNPRTQKLREDRGRKQQLKENYWREQDHILGMSLEMNEPDVEIWNRPRYLVGPRFSTPDDRYMISKHMDLYLPKEEMSGIHKSIVLFENALKLVSDVIAAEDEGSKKMDSEAATRDVESEKTGTTEKMMTEEPLQDAEKDANVTMATEAADVEASRRVKGAMRVGLLSKGLLMRSDEAEHLVIICSEKPTRSLLQRIVDHLPAQLELLSPQKKFNIETRFEESGLFVTIEEPVASFAVTLTSMSFAEDEEPVVSEPKDDLLSRTHCLSALTLLRRTKWFQVRLCAMKAGCVVTHVLRDLCRRNPKWAPLSDWAQELLVEKAIFAAGADLGPGEALRSFFECISSGILLPGGHGLMDPCEKEPSDVTASLTVQQSEDITASAQQYMRLIIFRQIYKVLDVPKFRRLLYKRPRDQDDKPESAQAEKKLKEDDAATGNGATSEDPVIIVDHSATEDP